MLPDWSPGLHPLVVHFPIALTFAAVAVDAAALVVRRRAAALVAAGLYGAAGLSTLAAFLTGRQMAGGAPPAAASAAVAHADWALVTVWALALYGAVRVAVAVWDRRGRLALHAPLAALGLGAAFLVWQTAERGSRLVYEYGVGVRAVIPTDPLAEPGVSASPGALALGEGGAWRWVPAPGQPLPDGLVALVGDREDLHPLPAGPDSLLSVHLGGGRLLLVAGEPRHGQRVDAALDLSRFEGTVALVHHARDADHYDFLAFDGAEAVQGRQAGAERTVFGRTLLPLSGAERLGVSAVGAHYYAYRGGEAVLHTHGTAPGAGRAGLLIEGEGVVRIGGLAVTPLE